MFARRLQAASHGAPIIRPFAINQSGGGLVDLKVATITGTPVLVDWGDGVVTTASSGVSVSHTYGSTYTGNVTVQSAGDLTLWESSTGKWSFDLSSLPAVMTYFYCTGANTISDYTGKTWANNQTRVYLVPVAPGGLSSLEVDQLLIDLAAAGGTWDAPKEIYLKGTNAARTAASNAAVATLQGKGVTVTTN